MASDSGHGGADSKTIGRFELLSELHKGFFGPVWLAHATSGDDAGNIVLVRRVEVSAEVDEVAVAAVAEAAERAKGVRHEALAATIEVFSEPREVAIVSEYQESEPLRTVLRLAGIGRKPVPPAVAARIAIDVLDACAHLHGLGSLAALTPDNVLVGSDGVTRVLEPMASQAAAGIHVWREQPKRATYAAPEQFGDEPGDERSDLFSMGILLWEMLRNRPLFGGSNFAQVGERVRAAAIGRADALKPAGGEAIPKALADIVERSLARKPDERYESAAAFLSALEGCEPADYETVARYANELLADAFGVHRRKLAGVVGAEPAPPKPAPAAKAAPPAALSAKPSAPTPEPLDDDAEPEVEPAGPQQPKVEAVAEGEPRPAPQPAKRREAKKTLMGMAAPTAARAVAASSAASAPPANKPKLPPSHADEDELELEPEPASTASRLPARELDLGIGDTGEDEDLSESAAEPAKARAASGGFDVMSIADDPSDPEDSSGEVAAALARQKQASAPAFKTIQAAPSSTTKYIAVGVGALVVLAAAAFFATRGSGAKAEAEATRSAATQAPAATADAQRPPATPTASPAATEVAVAATAAPDVAPAPTAEATTAPAAATPPPAANTAPPAIPQGPAPAPRPAPQPRRTNYVPSDI